MPKHPRRGKGFPMGPLIIDEAMSVAPSPTPPGPHDEWIAHGVRWTNQNGEVAVQPLNRPDAAPWKATALATMLRRIQAERGAVPDAGEVIRRMRGTEPISEWMAAGPSSEPTS